MNEHEEYFNEFIDSTVKARVPISNIVRSDWLAQPPTNVDLHSLNQSQEVKNWIKSWLPGSAVDIHNEFHKTAGVILNSYKSNVSRKDILIRETRTTQVKDCINCRGELKIAKINHAFWEHITCIYLDGYDKSIIRTVNSNKYLNAKRFQSSYFFQGLVFLASQLVRSNQTELFSVSYESGNCWHSDYMAQLKTTEDSTRDLAVEMGLSLFSDLCGLKEAKIQLNDSAFIRKLMGKENLNQIINYCNTPSNCFIFVVPPHLNGIYLKGIKKESQARIIISSTYIHENWLATLAAVANPIWGLLEKGVDVTIICQAAVMSALIKLYFDKLSRDFPSIPRVNFIDFGQALDLACIEKSPGLWAKNQLAHNPNLVLSFQELIGIKN